MLDGQEIVESEIQGNTRIFEAETENQNYYGKLDRVASELEHGRVLPPDTSFRAVFKQQHEWYQGLQKEFRSALNPGDAKRDYPTYSLFRAAWVEPHTVQFVSRIFDDWGLDRSALPRVLKRPLEHPFLYTHLEIFWCRLYLHMIEDMGLSESDGVDANYLFYLYGCDELLTEDRRFRRLGELVIGNARRISTLEEFVVSQKQRSSKT